MYFLHCSGIYNIKDINACVPREMYYFLFYIGGVQDDEIQACAVRAACGADGAVNACGDASRGVCGRCILIMLN